MGWGGVAIDEGEVGFLGESAEGLSHGGKGGGADVEAINVFWGEADDAVGAVGFYDVREVFPLCGAKFFTVVGVGQQMGFDGGVYIFWDDNSGGGDGACEGASAHFIGACDYFVALGLGGYFVVEIWHGG